MCVLSFPLTTIQIKLQSLDPKFGLRGDVYLARSRVSSSAPTLVRTEYSALIIESATKYSLSARASLFYRQAPQSQHDIASISLRRRIKYNTL